MTISISTACRNAKLDAITTYVGTSGLLRIYDGTPPASANAALSSNTLLATLPLSSTFAAGAAAGVLTASAITADSSADATGTATFFRILKSDATTVVCQGTVGTAGADLILNTTSIVITGAVTCSSLVLTEGNA